MGDKSAFVGGMKLKISELGKVITGNTPSKKIKEFWDKDDVGFVKPDIISDEHIVKIKSEDCNEFISNAAISKARIVPKNSIFVTCIGNIGKIGVATENLAFNQQINAIIPNENVNLDYLCYAIFANKTRLQDIANAPIVPLLNKSQFSEFELEFDMDINTQTRIVHELNTVSNIILKYKQELLLLDELVRARFVEMFGNPVIGTEKWPIHTVDNVAEAVDPQPSHRTPPIDPDGIPYVSIKDCDLKSGNIDFKGARKVSKNVLEEHLKRYELHDGDFIIGKIGTVGNPIFVPQRRNYALSANVVLVQPNKSVVRPYFLKYSFESEFVERQFNEAKNSTSQAAFGIQKVRLIRVMNPSLNVQDEFEKFAIEIDKSRSRIQKSLEASQELFDSLMQEYFG